ncbi:MAG TPA: TrkA family potassium uptake protein [Anaerolineales bacterium]|nr:TrkA family potassium uptake protein [Anaerolineales bacterium]
MLVLIVGGGRVGSHLASLLLELGHEVRVIENRPKVIEKLHREIPTECIHVGDAFNPEVLEQAGAENAQVMVAATARDETNLALATLGKFQFGIRRVIGRVNNPRNAWLFKPEMGIDVSLDQADVLARLIEEEMSLGDMMPLLKLRRGKYSLVEEKVPAGARAVGKMIRDLDLPDNCVIAGIIRQGDVVVPRGVTAIQEGDEVLAVVDREAAEHLAGLFKSAATNGGIPQADREQEPMTFHDPD